MAPDKPHEPPDRQTGGAPPPTVGHEAKPPGSAPPAVTPEPLLPHERDESLGGTDAQPRPIMEQAKEDLDAGQVDTDMRATPGLDAERRDRLVPDTKPR